ncbi:hypothetical protein HPB51_017581 [Rhipicephalus microplus]|uniref:Uncharacterized protein n=1 Tax=Rhipicephalus microplus TaxID=6941 RepID=A0A9J6F595_RHIMP|nr:hypothetical protein HPB51_017581 [Rhipicephalus microplus]
MAKVSGLLLCAVAQLSSPRSAAVDRSSFVGDKQVDVPGDAVSHGEAQLHALDHLFDKNLMKILSIKNDQLRDNHVALLQREYAADRHHGRPSTCQPAAVEHEGLSTGASSVFVLPDSESKLGFCRSRRHRPLIFTAYDTGGAIFGFYPGLLSGDAALSSMLPLLQHDDAVDCVPLVYPATPLEADHGTLHGFSDELLRVPPMTNVIYSKPFIANTWSATSTWDAIKAIAVAPRISGQDSGNTGMSLNRCLFFTQVWTGHGGTAGMRWSKNPFVFLLQFLGLLGPFLPNLLICEWEMRMRRTLRPASSFLAGHQLHTRTTCLYSYQPRGHH